MLVICKHLITKLCFFSQTEAIGKHTSEEKTTAKEILQCYVSLRTMPFW